MTVSPPPLYFFPESFFSRTFPAIIYHNRHECGLFLITVPSLPFTPSMAKDSCFKTKFQGLLVTWNSNPHSLESRFVGSQEKTSHTLFVLLGEGGDCSLFPTRNFLLHFQRERKGLFRYEKQAIYGICLW